MMINMLKV